jgi:dihydropteroate synthase
MKPAELGGPMAPDLEGLQVRRARWLNALVAAETPHLMGIINVTNDSFYAGSRAEEHEAVQRGLAMWDAGAVWIDIGGESTRPGAQPVSVEEETQRVVPVIETLRQLRPEGLISVDTRHSTVARKALEAGADMVNDVSGLRDPSMVDVVVEWGCAVCIMHMQGEPGTMQTNPTYDDCVAEVSHDLNATRRLLIERGHPPELIVLDPGIGFGKTQTNNIELLEAGRAIAESNTTPVLWGVSRKSIVGHITGHQDPNDRLAGTLGLAVIAKRKGVDLLRVHDVQAHVDLFAALNAIN